MAEAVSAPVIEVPAPEPGLTPAEMIARAAALKPRLRELQDDSERRGYYSEDIHRAFLEAGFHRILQPRRFGGYEFDLPTYWRTMVKIAEGDPGVGWCLTLGSHHAFVVGSHFSERAQRELFGPAGEFRAPHRVVPQPAQPVDGGYLVSGKWDYCSGVPYATHFLGNILVPPDRDGEEPRNLVVAIPASQFQMLDDWGGGATLGMASSGSNSVVVENVFVPEHMAVPWAWTRREGATPGTELHGNPMYLGMIYGVYHAGLVISQVGAARAALDEYEQMITTKQTTIPPIMPRYHHPDFQRSFGYAMALADSAEALVYRSAEIYMERARRWAEDGTLFTREDDARLFGILQQAGRLAAEATEELWRSAGSSASRRGSRLQRYFRDVAMYRQHLASQYLNQASDYARIHLGLPDNLF